MSSTSNIPEHNRFYLGAASYQGVTKAQNERPCEDASFAITVGDAVVVATIDGVSSASRSYESSKAIKKHLQDLLEKRVRNGRLHDLSQLTSVVREVRNVLLEQATADRFWQYAATIAVTSVQGPSLLHFRIGDGGALVRDRGGDHFVGPAPSQGSFTDSITDFDWEEKILLYRCASTRLAGFVSFTDGCENYFQRQQNDGPAIPDGRLFDHIEQMTNEAGSHGLMAELALLLRQDNGIDDDRSVAFIIPKKASKPLALPAPSKFEELADA